jgi:hypothetical protein
MLALTFWMLLSGVPQTHWQLPVTIQVTRDVEATNAPEPDGGQRRGRLYISRNLTSFVIGKDQTFQMINVGQEGECRIRFDKREYELGSCPWLDGFRDRQADIFKVIPKQ